MRPAGGWSIHSARKTCGHTRAERYDLTMNYQVEPTRSRHPIVKRAAAGLVLIVAAALAVHFIIGLIMTVFWIIVVVAAIVAVLWALKTI
jgi:hypothetical protein